MTWLTWLVLAACTSSPKPAAPPQEEVAEAPAPEPPPEPKEASLQLRVDPGHQALFQPLPEVVDDPGVQRSPERVALGRVLYFDPRLSKSQELSCNSCHPLDRYGADGEPTSPGHGGQRGARNSPSTYNAGLHASQFWDGRARSVEEQALGPILNPVEMAMPDEAHVVAVLKSIPAYVDAFGAAFPGDDPVTFENVGKAIGAFERGLLTPGPFDDYLRGDGNALTKRQRLGLDEFIGVGCSSCHMGPGVGGAMFQKLGLVKPYETTDRGRAEVTGKEADAFVFKVPSLRNVAETGPYLHDGSVDDLGEVVRIMGRHQLGKELSDEQVELILAFLGALTGEVPAEYVAAPALPESGPDTPGPDATVAGKEPKAGDAG